MVASLVLHHRYSSDYFFTLVINDVEVTNQLLSHCRMFRISCNHGMNKLRPITRKHLVRNCANNQPITTQDTSHRPISHQYYITNVIICRVLDSNEQSASFHLAVAVSQSGKAGAVSGQLLSSHIQGTKVVNMVWPTWSSIFRLRNSQDTTWLQTVLISRVVSLTASPDGVFPW